MRRPNPTFRALFTGLLLVLATLVLPSSPAGAGTTLLCKGFTDCARKGYGNYGYAAVYRQMHWRMYGGHNCTNYAAYRMIQLGGPTTRPWSGGGNASNWGVALASKTNRTPTVNSVAWWRSRNHVQIVERVIDANTIVVSEDHWRGDFNWAVVRRSSGHWPDGFIHIVDAPLQPSVPPAVPAVAQVGVPMTATPGTWPVGTTVRYQWMVAGVPVPAATAPAFTPRPEDVGKQVGVRVSATKPGHAPGVADSPGSQPVIPGTLVAQAAPRIDGVPKVTGVLQVQPVAMTPAAEATVQQWFADGAPIPGATGATLPLTDAHLGKRIGYRVVANRAGYQPLSLEAPATEPVGPQQLALTRQPQLVGQPVYGQTLSVDPGQVSVPGATVSYRWFRDSKLFPLQRGSSKAIFPNDIGTRISVEITWRRPGYDDVVTRVQSDVVKTRPNRFALRPTVRRGVQVRIAAPVRTRPYGYATLTLPSGEVRRAAVRAGVARFYRLPVGVHQVRVDFLGNRSVLPGAGAARVTIRR